MPKLERFAQVYLLHSHLDNLRKWMIHDSTISASQHITLRSERLVRVQATNTKLLEHGIILLWLSQKMSLPRWIKNVYVRHTFMTSKVKINEMKRLGILKLKNNSNFERKIHCKIVCCSFFCNGTTTNPRCSNFRSRKFVYDWSQKKDACEQIQSKIA